MPDQLLALGTGVGEGVVVAGYAVGPVVCLDVFSAIQGLTAFRTVKGLTHGGCEWALLGTQGATGSPKRAAA